MVSRFGFTVSDPLVMRGFLAVLRRASWCGSRTVVFHPTPLGLEVIFSSDALHVHVKIRSSALEGYELVQKGGEGEEVDAVETEGSTAAKEAEAAGYISVSARALTFSNKTDPYALRLHFDAIANPDELRLSLSFRTPLSIEKEFRLRRLPLPPVLLRLPPLRERFSLVHVAAAGRWWQTLVVSRRPFCLLSARPRELEVRWMDPAMGEQVVSPSSTSNGGGGEDIISVPQESFAYYRCLAPLVPSPSSDTNTNSDSNKWVPPPSKAVLSRHLRQGCLIIDKLGLGMEMTLGGPGIPLLIRSIEPVPLPSSSSSPSGGGGGGTFITASTSQSATTSPAGQAGATCIEVRMCIAAKDYPLHTTEDTTSSTIHNNTNNNGNENDRTLTQNTNNNGVRASGVVMQAGQALEVRARASRTSSLDIHSTRTTMLGSSEGISTSTLTTQPPPQQGGGEGGVPRGDTLVPPSFYSSSSLFTGEAGSTAGGGIRGSEEPSSRRLSSPANGGAPGLVNFAMFEQSPVSFMDAISRSSGDLGAGATRKRVLEDGNLYTHSARLLGARGEVEEGEEGEEEEEEGWGDDEMEAFLRECAEMAPPPPPRELEQPWDCF